MREERFLKGTRLSAYFSGPRRRAALAALLALSLLIAVWWGAHLWYRGDLVTDKRGLIAAELALYGNGLSTAIERRFGLLQGLKAFAESHASEATLGKGFEPFAAGLSARTKAIRSLVIAPGGVNRYVYPLAGNENVPGHDLIHDPRPNVRADVGRAIQSRQITLSGPYELRQGGLGIVARLAVYRNDVFWGLVAIVLDVPPILEEVGLHTHHGGLDLALRHGPGQLFFGESAVFKGEPVVYRVELPEGFWELAAIPSGGWSASIYKPLRLLDIGALAIAALLTALVYLVVNRDARLAVNVQRRTEEITKANEQLERELAERKRLEEELRKANEELERKVEERTASLENAKNALELEIRERKQIEQALRESEQRFRGIFDQTFQFVGLLRPDGTLLEANQTALDFLGLKRSDVVGRPFWETPWWTISPKTQNRLKAAIAEAAQGKFVRYEVDLLGPDGEVAAFDFSLKPVTDEAGRVALLIPEGRNITERKRAEQALRESEAVLQAIVDSSTRVIFLKDTQGRYILVNRQYEALFHVTRERLKGKTDYDLFPKEMAEAFRTNDLKVIEAGTPLEFEEVVLQDDGIHTYISNKFPMFGSGGVPYAVCGIATDITEIKRAEEQEIFERKKAETWLQRLIETTQDAVISIDRQGRIVLFNPAAEQIFGYTRAEVEGQKINLLMAEPYAKEPDGYIARYEQTVERRAIGTIRTVFGKRKNGDSFPMELSITEVMADEEIRYAAFIRDISEKIRLQAQLMENERLAAVGATSARLAHEIGNPLNGMSMTVQLLERRLAKYKETTDETVHRILRNLMGEISRLSQLLQEFGSLSRRDKYSFKPIALAHVAGEVFALERENYEAKGIQVKQSFPSDLPLIVADPDKLKQALLNLCKNAVEAMPQGGTLTLRAYNSGDWVVLEVGDTGTGIPAGVNIFEPFTTTKASGTGLGLVIVRQVVAAHGGTITYSSEHGKETVFRLSLPLTPPQQLFEQPPSNRMH